jgi:hypothetical protein
MSLSTAQTRCGGALMSMVVLNACIAGPGIRE